MNNFYWLKFPFVRYIFAFSLGIISYHQLTIPFQFSVIGLLILSISLLLLILLKSNLNVLKGFLGLTALLFLGYTSSYLNDDRNNPSHILNDSANNGYWYGKVLKNEVEKPNSYQTLVALNAHLDSGRWNKVNGKVIVYRSKDSTSQPLQKDHLVHFKGKINEVENPGNPFEFDYKYFLVRKNIFHQAFIKSDYSVVKKEQNFIEGAIEYVQSYSRSKFKNYISGKDERAVLLALVLGQKDELSQDLKDAYSNSGAMHILAVSGLHVGIIYLIINSIFSLFFSKKKSFLKALVSIMLIWFYAAITGFSPSVTRASIMFSFIIVAQNAQRQTNIYNTLAASAFFMLLFNPNNIFEVGFQLSYIAVLGIIYFYPKIYSLWYVPHAILDKIWQMSCVTISVQIVTFPLSLYYFNQFPIQGIITNLLAVPSAFLILSLSLIFLALSPINFFGKLLGLVLDQIIWFINVAIDTLSKLSLAGTSSIYLDPLSFILICLLILLSIISFETKSKKILFSVPVLLFLIAFKSVDLEPKGSYLIVFNERGKSSIGLIKNSKAFFPGQPDATLADLPFRPVSIRYGINELLKPEEVLIHYKDSMELFLINGKRILCLSKDWNTNKILKNKLLCDYLILKNESIESISELEKISAEQIIIDSSWSYYKAHKLKQELNNIHNTSTQGAFMVSL